MNAQRRKQLEEVWAAVDDAKTKIESILSEEQTAFDNLPESIQGSEKGAKMEEILSALEDAVQSADDCAQSLTDVQNL